MFTQQGLAEMTTAAPAQPQQQFQFHHQQEAQDTTSLEEISPELQKEIENNVRGYILAATKITQKLHDDLIRNRCDELHQNYEREVAQDEAYQPVIDKAKEDVRGLMECLKAMESQWCDLRVAKLRQRLEAIRGVTTGPTTQALQDLPEVQAPGQADNLLHFCQNVMREWACVWNNYKTLEHPHRIQSALRKARIYWESLLDIIALSWRLHLLEFKGVWREMVRAQNQKRQILGRVDEKTKKVDLEEARLLEMEIDQRWKVLRQILIEHWKVLENYLRGRQQHSVEVSKKALKIFSRDKTFLDEVLTATWPQVCQEQAVFSQNGTPMCELWLQKKKRIDDLYSTLSIDSYNVAKDATDKLKELFDELRTNRKRFLVRMENFPLH